MDKAKFAQLKKKISLNLYCQIGQISLKKRQPKHSPKLFGLVSLVLAIIFEIWAIKNFDLAALSPNLFQKKKLKKFRNSNFGGEDFLDVDQTIKKFLLPKVFGAEITEKKTLFGQILPAVHLQNFYFAQFSCQNFL